MERSSASDASSARDLGVVLVCRAAVSALVVAGGFRAVSDDDFARVVLAQSWAHAPKLDPTGTSWLPVPFWLYGALLRLFSPPLDVARAIAFALGLASTALIYVAARWITGERRAALAGTLLAVVLPWSACLGVATVPELPTAALTLFAIASLCTPPAGPAPPAHRALLGALALMAATLSRYEPWPIAVAFAIATLLAAVRLGQRRASQATLVSAALLAVAGPVAWVIWNRVAHGDALRFLARVAAYRQALSTGGESTLARLFAYPAAMIREEPELFLSPFVLSWVALRARRKLGAPPTATSAIGALFRPALPYAFPGALATFQIAALSLALVRDGAPTHHPERATLVALLLLALAVGAVVERFVQSAAPRERRALLGPTLGVLLVGLAARPHLRREHFNPRTDEVAIGRAAAQRVPANATLLIEVADYGYLAILAALGRPEGVIPDRSIDPRDPPVRSSFEEPVALARRIVEADAAYVIARATPPTLLALGMPVMRQGAWALWTAPVRFAAATPGRGPTGRSADMEAAR